MVYAIKESKHFDFEDNLWFSDFIPCCLAWPQEVLGTEVVLYIDIALKILFF